MIADWIKGQIKNSLSRELFYKIKAVPIIRLFFDFEYAGKMWNGSYIGKETKKLLDRTGINHNSSVLLLNERYLPYFICLCIALLLYDSYAVIPGAFLTAALLASHTKGTNFCLVFFMLVILMAVFALTLPFSAFFYILYVETGIILFFIIKYLPEKAWNGFIDILPLLWIGAALLNKFTQNSAAVTVVLMPYVIAILKKGKIRKYLYGAVILSLGFYVLSKEGQGAVIGGSLGVILTVLSGEWWLVIPVLLSVPAVISFAIRLINRNLIETSYFLWRYGFAGGVKGFDMLRLNGGYSEIVSVLFLISGLIFFWYILRLSRSVLIKLFKKDEENKSFLRSGLGSVVGFSMYTFFAYNENFAINIILYLISAAVLRRAGHIGRIREETGENGRKKDLSKKMRPDIPF